MSTGFTPAGCAVASTEEEVSTSADEAIIMIADVGNAEANRQTAQDTLKRVRLAQKQKEKEMAAATCESMDAGISAWLENNFQTLETFPCFRRNKAGSGPCRDMVILWDPSGPYAAALEAYLLRAVDKLKDKGFTVIGKSVEDCPGYPTCKGVVVVAPAEEAGVDSYEQQERDLDNELRRRERNCEKSKEMAELARRNREESIAKTRREEFADRYDDPRQKTVERSVLLGQSPCTLLTMLLLHMGGVLGSTELVSYATLASAMFTMLLVGLKCRLTWGGGVLNVLSDKNAWAIAIAAATMTATMVFAILKTHRYVHGYGK